MKRERLAKKIRALRVDARKNRSMVEYYGQELYARQSFAARLHAMLQTGREENIIRRVTDLLEMERRVGEVRLQRDFRTGNLELNLRVTECVLRSAPDIVLNGLHEQIERQFRKHLAT